MTNRLAAAGLAALAISLAGCNLGARLPQTRARHLPAVRATPQTEAAAWPAPGWWSGFRSPELDRLEAQAQAQNFDVAAAIARVGQADAQVRIASAPCSPPLEVTAAASYAQSSLNVPYETDFLGSQPRLAPVGGGQCCLQPLGPADSGAAGPIQGRLAASTETELGLAQQGRSGAHSPFAVSRTAELLSGGRRWLGPAVGADPGSVPVIEPGPISGGVAIPGNQL